MRVAIHHVDITVSDFDRSTAFYDQVLPPMGSLEYAPGYYAVFFADPDGIKLEYVFTPAWPA